METKLRETLTGLNKALDNLITLEAESIRSFKRQRVLFSSHKTSPLSRLRLIKES